MLTKETKNAQRGSHTLFRKFVSGGVGGMCLVIVGHPLDTIKVRLQTMPLPGPNQSPMYTGFYDCLQKSMASRGLRGLYQGASAPLMGSAPMYAMCFLGFEFGKSLQRKDDRPLTYHEVMKAGAIAGIFTAPVMGPVDRLKCLMQIQDRPGAMKFKSARHCLSHLYRTGGIRSIYRGTITTMIMEVPGCAAYFATYEYFNRELRRDAGLGKVLLAGGLAGVVCWSVAFPFDVIKSRRQTAPDGRYSGALDVAREAFRTEGYRFFFKGLTPVLIRAFPANGACFLGYEASERFFDRISSRTKPD